MRIMQRDFGDPKTRFFLKVRKTETCWLWTGKPSSQGYGRFTVDYETVYAHRAAWFFEHGVWPTLFVCHTCDNPMCVNPEHLFVGTAAENNFDCWLKERHKGFVRKVSNEQRLRIREILETGKSQRETAKLFGCSQATVSEIHRGLHEYAV